MIKRLVDYGIRTGLIDESERIYSTNLILDVMDLDSYEESEVCQEHKNYGDIGDELEDILSALISDAISRGVINDDQVSKDLFDTKLMNCITPRPSYVRRKFEKLYERAQALSCDAIATGHYARVCQAGERYSLKKAIDPTKDQSYVLYSLTQDQLARTIFPLGELTKQKARELAEAHGFLNAKKPDSQDICFVPDGDYAGFIERATGREFPEGDFISPDGTVLGRHKGIIHYTVGQRRGLGVSARAPLYVAAIDPVHNTVTLTEESGLLVDTVYADHVNIISGEPITKPIRARVKLRYRQPEHPATVLMEGENMVICFDDVQRAPAPGQAAVLYGEDGETVLGGGTITGSERRRTE